MLVVRAAVAPRGKAERHRRDGLAGSDGFDDGQFLWSKRTEFPGLHAGDGDARLVWPEKAHHRVANGCTQALHQVRPPLAHRHSQPGVAFRRLETLHLERAGRTVLQADTGQESGQALVGGDALHLGQVGARDLKAGVQKPVRGRSVVGDQQRALGVPVQSADGEDAGGDALQKAADGGPTLRVLQGGDDARRLVQHVPGHLVRRHNQFAVQGDQVVGFDLGAKRRGRLVIHRHPTGGDEFLGMASRGDAGSSQVTLQPFSHGALALFSLRHVYRGPGGPSEDRRSGARLSVGVGDGPLQLRQCRLGRGAGRLEFAAEVRVGEVAQS